MKKIIKSFLVVTLFSIGFTTCSGLVGIPALSEVVQAKKTVNVKKAVTKFTGKNYNVLPKNVKLPVTFKKKIDGDTFRVLLNNKEIKVRLLLVDTPETVKKNTPIQPYGLEASKYTADVLVNAKKIEVEFDKGDRTDRYNRALCYVYVDGTMLQESLVKEGLARVAFAYKPNTTYLKDLQAIEKTAKNEQVKIWSIEGYATKKGFVQE